MDIAVLVVRLVVGGLLLGAGLAKLLAGHSVVLRAIEGYDVLPKPAADLWARVLPVIEVGLGAILLAGMWSRTAAVLAALLLVSMTAAAAAVLVRGRKADCGCLGSASSGQVSWTIVARNLVLIVVLAGVVFEGGGLLSLDSLPWIRVWAALVVAAGVVAVISLARIHSREATI
jgi:uncharacterized membrane protein YphA (DoxX/SURF4 family)